MSLTPASLVGPFWVGDVPPITFLNFVDAEGDPYDLDGFTAATARVRRQNGPIVGSPLAAVLGGEVDQVEISWPAESILGHGGLYSLEVTITGTGTQLEAEPAQFVVQAHDGWLTLAQARHEWADAPEDDVLLHKLLASSRVQCLEYAPKLAEGTLPPTTWLEAQILQAKALWGSARSNATADAIGMEGYQVRLTPMAGTIKNLLRPKRAIPGIG